MKSSTETLIAAMRVLARDIQSGDGVANAAIAEAADRLEELHADHLRDAAKMIELEAQAAIGRRACGMLRALEWSRPVIDRNGFLGRGCIECGRGRESGHTEKCAAAAILRDAEQANSRVILDSSGHVRDATKMDELTARIADPQARIEELEGRINILLEQRNRLGQDVQNAAITGVVPENHAIGAQLGLVANMRAKLAELERQAAIAHRDIDTTKAAVDAGALGELREAMEKLRAPMSRPGYAVAMARIVEAAWRLLEGGE